MAREQHEVEPVFDLVDAVFDGDIGPWARRSCNEVLF